ncbi:MAG: phosphoenolpyruvate synthase, partial [Gammaproteobacteria bacterium]|nr:phosphoenolpyruvate synthase [Gammaproteobacteria bacterium]
KCHIHHYQSTYILPTALDKIKKLVTELANLTGTRRLDIEFAINQSGELYLFQVRPLISQINSGLSIETHQKALERITYKVIQGMKPHPYLHGKQTVYGVMPDWNPAEMIGIRPKPLALSLYKDLITDAVWAYQRDNYGYANLRGFPLLVDFEGLPYIDARVSFNSFLPKGLPSELADRLVNYYLDRLIKSPALHDKVEFDIVFSCYTLDLQKRLAVLDDYGFTQSDKEIISTALIELTNVIVHNQEGLWKKDLEKIHELQKRQEFIFQSELDLVAKMYWILEDCKRYGTLPFAGLARAGFIAVQILKSFVAVNIISEQEYTTFLSTVNSVSSNMTIDFHQLSKKLFLEKYGHLRPGTYDILSPRYDESPDFYFDWENKENSVSDKQSEMPFSLTIAQLRKIQEFIERDKLELTVLDLLEFIKTAIESREYAKFIFTRSISEFLRIFAQFSAQYGISSEDSAYINLSIIMGLYSSSIDPLEALQRGVAIGKSLHQSTSVINLPPLITEPSQVWSYELPEFFPNFITQKKNY